jgi:DNA-binding NarL/FixJ family response regulator
MYRVLLADDHPLFRQALRTAVTLAQPHLVIEEVGTLLAARTTLSRHQNFALILLDLKMPDCGGFSGLLNLRSEYPEIPILVVSGSETPATVSKAIALGAAGFIPKSASVGDIGKAVSAVLAGDIWTPASTPATQVPDFVNAVASLSPSQLRILMALQRGLLNKQIAHEMGVTEATVKAHMTIMFRKLRVQNRTQALIAAQAVSLDSEQMADLDQNP